MKALEGQSRLAEDIPAPEETGPPGPLGNRAHGHRISCHRLEISRFLMYNPNMVREIVAYEKAIVALCLDLAAERLFLFGFATCERTVVNLGDLELQSSSRRS
jgi:hypothetical protein